MKRRRSVPRIAAFGPCPECGGDLTVSYTGDYEPVGVAHPLPICATYARLSGDDYIRWVMNARDMSRAVGEA